MTNRAARRRAARAQQKRSRDATNEEIFPGAHGPLQETAKNAMRQIMRDARDRWPGYQFAMFVFEPAEVAARDGRAPRFNYASTVERADMLAVLRAFIAQNETIGAKLDKIEDAPPTEAKQ